MPTQRDILEAVSRGELSPEEAADQLTTLPPGPSGGAATPPPPLGGGTPSSPPSDHTAVRRVVVRASVCSVSVVGDSAVVGAEVSGRHQVRRDGGDLVVEVEPDLTNDDSGPRSGVFVFRRQGEQRGLDLREVMHKGWPRAQIRMNPDLPLDIEVDAGSATIDGILGPIRCDVDAGTAKITGFRHPIDIDVDAGTVTAEGVLTDGESRVQCDAGSVKLQLGQGSDVTVHVDVNLGRAEIRTPNPPTGGREKTVVVGAGTGSLSVRGDLANVEIDAAE